jgi:hypothetical protein
MMKNYTWSALHRSLERENLFSESGYGPYFPHILDAGMPPHDSIEGDKAF